MQTQLLQKESGGGLDTYSFTLGSTQVEVIHYEDGEYRSDQVLEPQVAWGLWNSLQQMGYRSNGIRPLFAPVAPAKPERVIAAPKRRSPLVAVTILTSLVSFWVAAYFVVTALV